MSVRVAVMILVLLGAAGACRDHDPRSPHEVRVISGASPRSAPAHMRHYGCTSCHTIPGVRGANAKVGPSLAGFPERQFIAGRLPNEPEELIRWIMHPQSIKPGTAMPDMGVSGEHARDIAAYLYGSR
jgi:cytochrome c